MNKIEQALELVEKGYAIFPCVPDEKRPLTSHGFKDASNDVATVKRWWQQCPDANIGLPTGPVNGLVVIDVDIKEPHSGFDSLSELEAEFEPFSTYRVDTPSGGCHFYYSYDKDDIGNSTGFLPGIDIRADGGYVVAPGSTIQGAGYSPCTNDFQFPVLPDWLELKLKSPKQRSVPQGTSISTVSSGIPEGQRNDTIFRLACTLRGRGVPKQIATEHVLAKAQECDPPLPSKEALVAMESAYERYEPNQEHYTDLGNAKRLISNFGEDLRYIPEFGKWLYWNGHCWKEDKDGHVVRLAKATARAIWDEAEKETNPDVQMRTRKHAMASESRSKIEAMVSLAQSEEGVPVSQSELDSIDYLLGVQNGVVDLRTGKWKSPERCSYITKQAGVSIDTDATCPLWMKFLDDVTGGDTDLITYLQRAVGYTLTGSTKEQVLFFLWGTGANGKSTFTNVIQEMLGEYAKQTQPETLMVSNGSGINNDIARLRGSRLVVTTETEDGQRFAESMVKQLTGGDRITARFLHQEFFEFTPKFKIWISGNYKPAIRGSDYGIWRRIKLIPFNVQIPEGKRDSDLPRKLRKELPGILNWAIEGCLDWQKHGLVEPSVIKKATEEYRSDMDQIKLWMDDCCTESSCATHRSSELYQSYRDWSIQSGEWWKMSQKRFSDKLIEHGYQKKRTSRGSEFTGLKLREDTNPVF